jgi:hypothetical protein
MWIKKRDVHISYPVPIRVGGPDSPDLSRAGCCSGLGSITFDVEIAVAKTSDDKNLCNNPAAILLSG